MTETLNGKISALKRDKFQYGDRLAFMVGGTWCSLLTNKSDAGLVASLEKLQKDDYIKLQVEKNSKGYYEITGIEDGGGRPEPQPTTPPSERGRGAEPRQPVTDDRAKSFALAYAKDIVVKLIPELPAMGLSEEGVAEAVANAASLTLAAAKTLMTFWDKEQ